MINFSVSRPGSMSKPMRACESKKNKVLKISMPTHIPAHAVQLLIIMILISRHFSVGFFSYLHCPSWGLVWREKKRKRGRDRLFCSHPPHLGEKKLNKGLRLREAASTDLKFGKNGRDSIVFFAWCWKSMRAEDEKQRNLSLCPKERERERERERVLWV